MSAVATEVIDHVRLGLSRVLKQFQESQRLIEFLKTILSTSNELEMALQSMLSLPSIDEMTGANLDTIGNIVGASRFVGSIVDKTYFGFEDTGYYATCFGEEGVPNVGARFYEEGEYYLSNTVLADPEYRILIRAKIVKNSSLGTCEDIISALRYLFSTEGVHLIDNGDMTIAVQLGRQLYATELALVNTLDILPRPAGVRITGVTSYVEPGDDYTGGDPPYGEE
jgi:hypothetical protein